MKYRVLIPQDEPNPIKLVNQFLTADGYVAKEGAYLIIETEGTFTAPGAEEIPAEFTVENEDGSVTNA